MIVTAETQETTLLPPSGCLEFCSADVVALFIIFLSIYNNILNYGDFKRTLYSRHVGTVKDDELVSWKADSRGLRSECCVIG